MQIHSRGHPQTNRASRMVMFLRSNPCLSRVYPCSSVARAGIVVYRATSLEEAKQYAEGDPMVKAGRLEVELHQWYLAKGVLK